MTLQSEVEQLRKGARALLPLAVALALAFLVGLAFKELFDSRTVGAAAWLLVFMGFALASTLSTVRSRPESLIPVLTSVGAGLVASALLAVAMGSPAVASLFVILGGVSLLVAWRRSRNGD